MKKIFIIFTAAAVSLMLLTACAAPSNADYKHYEPVTEDMLTEGMMNILENIMHKRGYSIIGEADGYLYVYFGSGEKPTGGYAISLVKMEGSGDDRIILIKETSPGKDDVVTEALTYPYMILKIEKKFFEGAKIMKEAYEQFNDIESEAEKTGIIGMIVSVEKSQGRITLLVEGKPAENTGYDKAYVKIDGDTVVKIDGEAADMEKLAAGMEVLIVFKGPVAESYPVQAYASEVKAKNSPGIDFETVNEEEECIQYIRMHRGFGLIREDDHYYYIFIGAGEKNTGGYSINVKTMVKSRDTILITVAETVPGKDDMVIQVITYPYQVIRISKEQGRNIIVVSEDGEVFEDINDEKQ